MNDQLYPFSEEDPSQLDLDKGVALLDPAVITSAGAELLDSDYETAKSKLKDLYENNEWSDPEMAGQYLSQVYNNLNRIHDVKPEIKLDSEVNELAKDIFNPALKEDAKLDAIEKWRENTKAALYSSKSADTLVSGFAKEQLIDFYATEFRRDIVAKDRPRILDMFTRGVEAAVAPIAGVTDLAFGTDLEESLRKKALDYENPAYDESILSIAASGIGSVGGFAAATLNPYTGWAYLGAMLTDQGKSVYDQAYAATGSRESARTALMSAAPGIAIGTVADRLVGGSLGAVLKGQKGYLNALTGMVGGAGGFVAQSYGMGEALATATGEEAFSPTAERLAKEALVGGAIGGLVGGARDISIKAKDAYEARINKAREEVQKQFKVEKKPEVEAEEQPNAVAEVFVKKGVVEPGGEQIDRLPVYGEENYFEELQSFIESPHVLPETIYHGTQSTFLNFDNKELGRMTGTASARRGHWAAGSPEGAKYWSESDAPGGTVNTRGSNIRPLKLLTRNPYIIDMEGEYYSPRVTRIIDEAKAAGHDAVIFKNLANPNIDTNYIWFSPDQVVPEADYKAAIAKRSGHGKKGGQDADTALTRDYGPILDAAEADEVTKLFPFPKSTGFAPIPMILELVREMGAIPGLANMLKTWGFYATPTKAKQEAGAKPKVMIMRQIFKDKDQAEKTIAHEALGHMIDSVSRTKEAQEALKLPPDRNEPIWVKMLRFRRDMIPQFDNINFKVLTERLSRIWRPGWDEKPQYRSKPTEIFADVMSAIFQNPDWVQEQFPTVFKAFELGMENFPELKSFWKQAQEMRRDPTKLAEWVTKQREKGRIKEAEIFAKAEQQKLEKKAEQMKKEPKEALTDTMAKVVNQFHTARLVVEKMIKQGFNREAAWGMYNKLYNWKNAHKTVEALLDTPLARKYEEYKDLGIPGTERDPLSAWKDYERANRVINDTTEFIEDIKANPAKGLQIQNDIREVLKMAPGVKFKRNIDVTGLEGWSLVEELAKFHHEILDPVDRLKLRKILIDRGKLDAAELFAEDSLNVRSLIANPDMTRREAETVLSTMKQKLGPEKFAQLEAHSRGYHEIFSSTIKALDEAGLLSDKMRTRLELNKDNYITTNVLKYFEKDPTLSATLRSQYGTIDQVGDELAATEMKMKALMIRAELQKSMNAGVEIARQSGVAVTEAPEGYEYRAKGGKNLAFKKSVYDQKEELQKKNPEKSYLVEYEDGKPTLWEINSPAYAKMFEGKKWQKDIPLLGYGLRLIEATNRWTLAREAKTIFSLPFVWSSKFYDTAQEALVARSKELPGLFFHTSKELRAIKREARDIAKQAYGGIITPQLKEIIEANGIPYLGAEAFVGHDTPMEAFAHGVYKAMGIEIPGEETIDRSLRVSKKLNTFIENLPFMKAIKRTAMTDELSTKIAGYLIGRRVRGMGPQESALLAREYFGTPDPTGGGSEAANINKLFLFGRAHINGMRGVANQLMDSPSGFGAQYVYRKLVPRLLMSGGIMGPLVGALFGEEEEKIYRKFCDKVSAFDKVSKLNMPLGFIDSKGNWRGFNVKSDDIQHDWKAMTVRVPVSRDLVAMDQLTSPMLKVFEELADTGTVSLKHIAQNTVAALNSVVGGSLAPPVQWGRNISSLLAGSNPQDYYRNRGILPKDVQEAGAFYEKFYQYMLWSVFNHYPSMFNYKYKAESTEPTSTFEYLARIPQVGQLLQRYVGASNYGEYEKFKDLEQQKIERDAEIRLNLGADSRKLFNEYRKSQALISKLGKGWQASVSPEYVNKVHLLNNWHSHIYAHAFNEMRAAFENGDDEEMKALQEKTDQLSQYYLDAVK